MCVYNIEKDVYIYTDEVTWRQMSRPYRLSHYRWHLEGSISLQYLYKMVECKC